MNHTKPIPLYFPENCDSIDISHSLSPENGDNMRDLSKTAMLRKHPHKIWKNKQGRWNTYFDQADGKRIRRVRNTREEIENLIFAYYYEIYNNPTIKELFTEYDERRVSFGRISEATFSRDQKIFKRHCEKVQYKRIKNIKPLQVVDWLECQVSEHNLTRKGFSNLKTLVRGVFKRARRLGYIDWSIEQALLDVDTTEAEFRRTYKEPETEVFDERETILMMDYLEKHPDPKNLGLLLLFVTGMRVGELTVLSAADIGPNFISIHRTESNYTGRDGKQVSVVKDRPKTEAGFRAVTVPGNYLWLLDKIRQLNPFGEFLFVNDKGKRITEKTMQMRLYRNCDKIGITRKSPHKIRKTYVSILLDAKVDQRFILDQVGHVDIETSENYYHRNRKTIDRKQQILDEIPDFGGGTFDSPMRGKRA